MSSRDASGLRLVWSRPAVAITHEHDLEIAAMLASLRATIREHRREKAIAARLDAYRRTGVVCAVASADDIEPQHCHCRPEANHDAAF